MDPTSEAAIRINTGRVVDGTGKGAAQGAYIVVRDDRIAGFGEEPATSTNDLATVDLTPYTVLPGLVDAHMHFFGVPSDQLHLYYSADDGHRALRAAGEAKKMLEAGITSARCLGSSVGPALARAIHEGHVPGPRLVAAGEFINSTSGTWDHFTVPIALAKAKDMIADGVENMRAVVRRRIRNGSSVIKLGLSKGEAGDEYHSWGDSPLAQAAAYSEEEVLAAVTEAHINHLKVSAHCIGDVAVRLALTTGVDVIEHGYGVNDETRKMLAESGTLVVSTISQLYFHLQCATEYRYPRSLIQSLENHIHVMQEDFQKSLAAGVRYALGTDLIGYPTHPQDRAAKEFELAAEWGMSPADAIKAGTMTSAEALGMLADIGSVEVGKKADLIAVEGNPLVDMSNLSRVVWVMQDGEVVVDKRRSSSPNFA